MKPRHLFAGVMLGALAGAVGATTAPNWIAGVLMSGATQTTVVRHPIDKQRYYLCWTDGSSRYGLSFRKSKLNDQLRVLAPGGRQQLSNMLSSVVIGDWKAADERLCWPA